LLLLGGEIAGISSGSVMRCRVSDGIKPNRWSAGVIDFCRNLILVQLLSPPSSVVGRARLSIDTVLRPTESPGVSLPSIPSMSVADEYDVITGGYDVREQEV